MKPNKNGVVSEARDVLKNIADIVTEHGKRPIEVQIRAKAAGEDAAVSLRLSSPAAGLTALDREIVFANLFRHGGFRNINESHRGNLAKTVRYSAIFGHGAPAPDFDYGEITVADLIRFINRHSANFPRGLNTRVTLGDFEGNTFHRKVNLAANGQDLHISYELNELAD